MEGGAADQQQGTASGRGRRRRAGPGLVQRKDGSTLGPEEKRGREARCVAREREERSEREWARVGEEIQPRYRGMHNAVANQSMAVVLYLNPTQRPRPSKRPSPSDQHTTHTTTASQRSPVSPRL